MKNIILLIILLSLFSNCSSKKSNSQNENFEYQNGNEKISVIILTANKYLIENNTTQIKFKFENIDPKVVSISGRTIKFIKNESQKENELLIEATPQKEDLENGKLKLFLFYKSNEKSKTYELNIPVNKN
jgi:hypothetical protein